MAVAEYHQPPSGEDGCLEEELQSELCDARIVRTFHAAESGSERSDGCEQIGVIKNVEVLRTKLEACTIVHFEELL